MSLNLVDSSAWLAFFSDEPSAGHFAPVIEDVAGLVVPVVCLHEVYKILRRECDEDTALEAIGVMQEGLVVDIDASLSIEAATLALEERLSFADSHIYAVAQRYGATLWTQDEHFRDKPGVRYFPKPQAGA